ncbi:hypothetical protein LSM04_009400 [Trypanosoma melophagium]|uniref:uncharacterized protein n=1 Tax=Trypanosoma melophagium TaxID=715481 RepID=UPI00351A9A4A|nr:hypothetical protein LSM04_009400 [Trypanosoma melophagium]
MYVAPEAVAWFDPALLTTEHLEQDSEDHQGVTQIITSFTFIPQRLSCPIDSNKEPFSHVVSAGGTDAVVTDAVPQYLCFFGEENDIFIGRLRLPTDKSIVGDLKTVEERGEGEEELFIDEQDIVAAIYLDPRGNFCIVRWRSGKAVYYYIPCRQHDEYSTNTTISDNDMMMMMMYPSMKEAIRKRKERRNITLNDHNKKKNKNKKRNIQKKIWNHGNFHCVFFQVLRVDDSHLC